MIRRRTRSRDRCSDSYLIYEEENESEEEE